MAYTPMSPLTVGVGWTPSPTYTSGYYYWCHPTNAATTNSVHGNGVVRVNPFVVVAPVTVTELFAEFTAAGEANSVLRLGIWNDSGAMKPGTLKVDAGTISTGTGNAGTVSTGGTPGVYAITGLSAALTPGLYWIGGAVQGAASTQPTLRTVNAPVTGLAQLYGQSALPSTPGASTYYNWAATSVSGAFGASFGTPAVSGQSAVRVGFRAA